MARTTQLAMMVRRTVYSNGGHSIRNLVSRRNRFDSVRIKREVGPSFFSSTFFFFPILLGCVCVPVSLSKVAHISFTYAFTPLHCVAFLKSSYSTYNKQAKPFKNILECGKCIYVNGKCRHALKQVKTTRRRNRFQTSFLTAAAETCCCPVLQRRHETCKRSDCHWQQQTNLKRNQK